jgi:hypothetical protein
VVVVVAGRGRRGRRGPARARALRAPAAVRVTREEREARRRHSAPDRRIGRRRQASRVHVRGIRAPGRPSLLDDPAPGRAAGHARAARTPSPGGPTTPTRILCGESLHYALPAPQIHPRGRTYSAPPGLRPSTVLALSPGALRHPVGDRGRKRERERVRDLLRTQSQLSAYRLDSAIRYRDHIAHRSLFKEIIDSQRTEKNAILVQ